MKSRHFLASVWSGRPGRGNWLGLSDHFQFVDGAPPRPHVDSDAGTGFGSGGAGGGGWTGGGAAG